MPAHRKCEDLAKNVSASFQIKKEWEMFSLPFKLTKEVFLHLDSQDIIKASNVCRFFNQVGNDDYLWQEKFRKTFSFEIPDQNQSAKKQYQALEKELKLVIGHEIMSQFIESKRFFSLGTVQNKITQLIDNTAHQIGYCYLKKMSPALGREPIKLLEKMQNLGLENYTNNRINPETLENYTVSYQDEFIKIQKRIERTKRMLNYILSQPYTDEVFKELFPGYNTDDKLLCLIGVLCQYGMSNMLRTILSKSPIFAKVELRITDSWAKCFGFTFLYCAIYFLQYDNIKLLLQYGADVNKIQEECAYPTPEGISSPLFTAIYLLKFDLFGAFRSERGNDQNEIDQIDQIIQLLLKHGADPDLKCANTVENQTEESPRELCHRLYKELSPEKQAVLQKVMDCKPCHTDSKTTANQLTPS